MATKTTEKPVKPAQTAATPSHSISLRGKEFVGTVVSAKAHRTVTVQWNYKRFVPKYERYEAKTSKVAAHNPDEINAQEGDTVRIKESRPLSKTKHFVVVEVLEKRK